jgi:HSP90 family molecular chaperone
MLAKSPLARPELSECANVLKGPFKSKENPISLQSNAEKSALPKVQVRKPKVQAGKKKRNFFSKARKAPEIAKNDKRDLANNHTISKNEDEHVSSSNNALAEWSRVDLNRKSHTAPEEYSSMLEAIQSRLNGAVKGVRLSNRTDSLPSFLAQQTISSNPESSSKGTEFILELNPSHEIIVKARHRFSGNATDPFLDDFAQLMFGSARLSEGSKIEDPMAFKEVVLRVLSASVSQMDKYTPLLEALHRHLYAEVKEVRLSQRLVSSPVCLVVSDDQMSPHLERLLNSAKGESSRQKRIMELNPNHTIILRMRDRLITNPNDPLIGDFAELMFGNALLAEGSEVLNVPAFNRAVLRFMTDAISKSMSPSGIAASVGV